MLALVLLLGLAQAGATLFQPWLTGNLVAALSDQGPVTGAVLLVCIFFVADAIITGVYSYGLGVVAQRIVYRLRMIVIEKVVRMRMLAYHHLDRGDTFTRIVSDTSIACLVVSQATTQLITSAFLVAGGVVLMTIIDAPMAATALALLGGASLLSLFFARLVRSSAMTNRRNVGAFGTQLNRILSGLTTIKASVREKHEVNNMSSVALRARRSGVRVSTFSALLQPTMNVGTQLALAGAIIVGVVRLHEGHISMAQLTAFIMYLFYLVAPLVTLFSAFGQIQQGRASMDRVTELMNLPQEDTDPAHNDSIFADDQLPTTIPHHDNELPILEFDDVEFSYDDTQAVLRNVSFQVPARGITAIAGLSGAGKTTVLKLAERFYEPSSGKILLAGNDITQIPLPSLRRRLGYVEQDCPVLAGTLRENLVYEKSSIPETDVLRVLDLLGLTPVLDGLPDGLDSHLDEEGSGLSGGERQRIALARALLKRPEVLVLDEVTAHLDRDTEQSVTHMIREVSRTCAVVVVSHQIALFSQADKIVMLDGGTVRGTGTHATMMRSDSLYKRFISQAG